MQPKTFVFTLILLVAMLLTACASTKTQGSGTPIPTLMPATPPPPSGAGKVAAMLTADHCSITAVDLIGAWVTAGSPEKDPFKFTDANGLVCQGTFENDVQFLFNQSNVWFTGALACSACHGPDLNVSYAQMDLSTYQGILSGSRRQSPEAKGNDLLGGGDWEKSQLRQVLVTKYMPLGRPQTSPENGPLVYAGTPQ